MLSHESRVYYPVQEARWDAILAKLDQEKSTADEVSTQRVVLLVTNRSLKVRLCVLEHGKEVAEHKVRE